MSPSSGNGRFDEKEILGQGGTASVVRAYDHHLGKDVALKQPLAQIQQTEISFEQLAQREFSLIGQSNHPGLVHIIEKPAHNIILLELCNGPTLDQIKNIPYPIALDIISAIAANLEYLHTSKLVHGDLKPSNIFLPNDWQILSENNLKFVKLSDFSLGMKEHESIDSRLGVGTIGYMPPETINDNIVSHQSDLFALGVIAYQLLADKHPFAEGITDPALIHSRIIEDEPLNLNTLNNSVTSDIINLVNNLLAKSPDKRTQSASEVCLILEQAGATYSWRKLMRPSYMIYRNESNQEICDRLLNISEQDRTRLDDYADADPLAIRLILEANFNRSNLDFENCQYSFKQSIYWPSRCRHRALSLFASLAFSQKKDAIKAAIVADRISLPKLVVPTVPGRTFPCKSLDYLLPSFLKPVTIKRFSKKLADLAERENLAPVAAHLHLQAGDFIEAERAAHQAAYELHGSQKTKEATRLLHRVIDFGCLIDKHFETRHLLLIAGDIQKESGDLTSAQNEYEKIISLYQNREEDQTLALTLKKLGDLHRLMQNFTEAIKALNRSLEIFTNFGNDLEISHVLNNIGNAHWLNASMNEALSFQRKALKIQRRLGVTEKVASTLNNIGNIFGMIGRLDRCVTLLTISLKLKEELGNAGEMARTLNNLGYVFYLQGKISNAADSLKRSLDLNRRIGSRKEILFNLENLAAILLSAGRLKQATGYYREGLKSALELNDTAHACSFYIGLADIEQRHGNYKKAYEQIQKADDCCKEIDSELIANNLSLLRAQIDYNLGATQTAQQSFTVLLDSSRSTGDHETELSVLIAMVKISNDRSFANDASEIIERLHMRREKRLLLFSQLEFYMNNNDYSKIESITTDIVQEAIAITDDIELPSICILASQLMLHLNDHEKALLVLNKAIEFASEQEMYLVYADAIALRGKIKFDKKEYEKSYSDLRIALATYKQLMQSITNKVVRNCFQNRPTILALAEQIKELGNILSKK